MKINPLARELNETLEREAPAVLEMLSDLGHRLYFPKGIISQSAEAKVKAKKFNATIGIALEGGVPMHLPSLHRHFQGMEPGDLYPYAPVLGKPELRKRWREKQLEENPRLREKKISDSVVTCALTHGTCLAGEMFINPGDPIVVPDQLWGNYRLTFEVRQGGVIETFPFYDGGGFNRKGFAGAIRSAASRAKKILTVLNFPNNPTGYTPTPADAEAITEVLVETAEKGTRVVAVSDDAYFGLFYDDACLKESIFGYLAGAHPNLLAIKLDGATKEEFVWGFRVGFITYGMGGSGDLDAAYGALEKKTGGAIRGSISNAPHVSQSLVLSVMNAPGFKKEQAEKRAIMKARGQKVMEVLANPKYSEVWTPYPFNSGYFMCLELKNNLEAEKLRVHLLDRYGLGTIATARHDIRVAFSCIEESDIPEVYDTIYRGALDLLKK